MAAVLLLPLPALAQAVSFGSSGLQGEELGAPTSLQFGPDGRLYVAQQYGIIFAYTVVRNGPNDYAVASTETIELVLDIPNREDDDGSLTDVAAVPVADRNRQITGILVTGTAANPVLYVTSSDPRIGAGGGGNDLNLDTNSGVISRLTCVGGIVDDVCTQWEKVDLVRGLPRSEENHAPNGMALDATTNTLYLAQGGNTNAGSPSNNFAFTTEYALAAAVLSIDLNAIEALPTLTDAEGQQYVYDLPTVDDPTRPNVDGCVSAPGNPCVDVNDPWGGNDGLNQAKVVPGGPVQIYAGGFRNLYDLVITESGRIYGVDNGANVGWGGYPQYEESFDCTNDFIPGEPGSKDLGPDPATYPVSVTLLDGSQGTVPSDGAPDAKTNNKNGLHLITDGYYAGHPTPLRGNPEGAGLYVDDTFYAPGDPRLPVDWPAVPLSEADPRECDFQNSGVDDQALANFGPSTNGITEYTASNFGGVLQGNLLAAGFVASGPIYRMALNEDGTVVTNCPVNPENNCNETLFSGFGAQPLDVVAQGDDDPFPGTVWAAVYGPDNVQVFEPADYDGGTGPLCTGDDLDTIDEDGDLFSNADEIDNGTDPCSGGEQPTDNDGSVAADGFKDSDLNDPDDDDDGLTDPTDPFALDAANGLATTLPLDYAFFNETPGVTVSFFGLGFTGLMTNGTTDYRDQFIERSASNEGDGVIAGGTAGILTIPKVTEGDAAAGDNTQENAFQFGVAPPSVPFTIEAQMNGPLLEGARADFASQGIFIGTGDQDNYLSVAVIPTGLLVAQEDAQVIATDTFPLPGLVDATRVRLFLAVDPTVGTVQVRYAQDDEPVVDLGGPVSLTGALLDAVQGTYQVGGVASGLAIGVIATSAGPAPEFAATWDYFLVTEDGASDASALLQVTLGGPVDVSTFGNNSFQVTNTGGQDLVRLAIDASTAFLPDVVFDPLGKAGDSFAKCLTAGGGGNSPAEVGLTVPADGGSDAADCQSVFAGFHNGTDDAEGYDVLSLDFTDFNPGEAFAFGVDMDPTSIRGDLSLGDAGSISGFELIGATVTFEFADGTVVTTSLFEEGSLGGSQAEGAPGAPAPAPTLATDVPLAPLDGDRAGATVFAESQTLSLTGPPGAAFSLLQVDARLYIDPGNPSVGYDLDPLEANEAVARALYTGTFDGSGAASVAVTLLRTPGTDGAPDGGLNHFIAVVDGAQPGAGAQTSRTSNVLILAYATGSALPVSYNAGWALVSLPVDAADPDYLAVFEAGAGGDPASPVFVTPNTLFEFDGAYGAPDPPALTPGVGAWLNFAQTAAVTHQGGTLDEVTLSFGREGWHLVGPPTCALPVSALEADPNIVAGTVFGFAGAYTSATTLEAGRGYWVRVAEGAPAFDVVLSCAAAAAEAGVASSGGARAPGAAAGPDGFATLYIADARGFARALHFGGALAEDADAAQYALPPVPPRGAFDARLAGDARLVEGAAARVRVQTSAYPLRVRIANSGGGGTYDLDVVVGGEVVGTHTVAAGAMLDIHEPATELVVRVRTEALPEAFALVGAYPNPLREEATVAFDLPAAAEVRLELYDVLGRRQAVRTEALEAGAGRQVRLRASGLSSGVYVFRLEATLGGETVVEAGRLTVVR